MLAYANTFHDTLYEDGWFGGGEYYDEDGQLAEAPVYYQKLETIIPEICQIFGGYTLHPEMAMNRQDYSKHRA